MSQAQILVLGAIAGLTIFIGLPVGRVGRLPISASTFLAATATGILLFLLWDVLAAGVEPVESALTAAAVDHTGGWGRFAWLAVLLGGGFVVGLMSLVYFDEVIARRRRAGGPYSVGAAVAVEAEAPRAGLASMLSPAQSLSLMIATGIGLHNFSEGLAIGQSAASGEISLALMLDHRLRPAQRHRGLRHRRAVRDERRAPVVGLPAARRADRRRPDVLRHPSRPDVGQRSALGRVPRPRRRLDPLRRDRAARRLPPRGAEAPRRLGADPRPHARLRDGLRPRRGRRLTRLQPASAPRSDRA